MTLTPDQLKEMRKDRDSEVIERFQLSDANSDEAFRTELCDVYWTFLQSVWLSRPRMRIWLDDEGINFQDPDSGIDECLFFREEDDRDAAIAFATAIEAMLLGMDIAIKEEDK